MLFASRAARRLAPVGQVKVFPWAVMVGMGEGGFEKGEKGKGKGGSGKHRLLPVDGGELWEKGNIEVLGEN